MIFNDLYKYEIDDFLKIETNRYIYCAYVHGKAEDVISIIFTHPSEYNKDYFKSERKLEVGYAEEILSIKQINMNIFRIGNHYEINKRVFKKNGPIDYIEKYGDLQLKLVYIDNHIRASYPFSLVKPNDTHRIAFSPVELLLCSKDMYKPRIKVNEVFKFNNFNKIEEKIVVEEETKKFKEYFEQIEEGNFYTINDELWNIITDNNYDEKYDTYEEDDWEYRKLKISDSDEFGLIIYDENIIDKFEEFTKILKAKHKHTLAYVDNENGIVYILKTKKK
jgi:hypothetical protein